MYKIIHIGKQGVAGTVTPEMEAIAAQTALDAIATAADRVQTGLDAAATGADVVSTGADATQTGLDVIATADNRVQTGLDVITTAANRVQTAMDAIATAADRIQTGIDATTAETAAEAAQAAVTLIIPNMVNSIGTPGAAGFGVGICPELPAGFIPLPGHTDPAHANYGNYQYEDGSVMVWVPKFWYRIAHASNPSFAVHGVNSVDVKGLETFTSTAAANAAGYALHRAFIDGGVEQPGFFFDKYLCSRNAKGTGFVPSSIQHGLPLSTAYDHNSISNLTAVRTAHPATRTINAATKATNCQLTFTTAINTTYVAGQRFAISGVVGMTQLNGQIATVVSVVGANNVTVDINSTAYTTYVSGGTATAGTNAVHSAVTAVKSRDGVNGAINATSRFHVVSRFQWAAIALLSLAHGQAATATTYCAWYSATTSNFPKGCNNNALKDSNDTEVTYTSDGYSNCGKTGSGTPFAKTTHNGQACGIADVNGLMFQANLGLTCIAASKPITAATQANPCQVTTSVAHDWSTGAKVQITGVVGMTQLNDQMYTITVVDATNFTLDGIDSSAYTAYTSGGAAASGSFYVAKESTRMRDFTGGNTLASDHWGATGVSANMEAFTPPFAAAAANDALVQRWGNGANQVLAEELSGAPWLLTGLGLPQDSSALSPAGSNLFGADYFYQHVANDLCLMAALSWSGSSLAGVCGLSWSVIRSGASSAFSFRAACYLGD